MPPQVGTPHGWRGAPRRGLLRRLGIEIRPGEGALVGLLFCCFFLLTNFQYAAKSIRQSTFVSALGAERLPWVYLLVALCSFGVLHLYGRRPERLDPYRQIAGTFLLVGLGTLGFWWALALPGAWVEVVLYVFLAIAFGLTVSQFWLLAGLVLDARQARRLFGLVGVGGLLGGASGGQVARLVSGAAGTRGVVLAAALLIGGAAWLVLLVRRRQAGREPAVPISPALEDVEQAKGGFALLRGSPHLQMIALTLGLGIIVGQIIDLQFNWVIETTITAGVDERTAYFGNIFTAICLAAIVFQLLLTSRIHRSVGVGTAVRVLPAAVLLGTGGLLAAVAFFPAALLRASLALKVGETGLRFSLEQATRELLFVPVPRGIRMKIKAFIDVFVQRSAKGVAALLLLPVTFGLLSPLGAMWGALALAAVWLAASGAVYHHYLATLRQGLAQRRAEPGTDIRISDATTLELLIESLGSRDPRVVLNSLEILARHGRGHLVMPLLLHHADAEVRGRTLEILGDCGREDAVPLIEERLKDPEPWIRALAIRVLERLGGEDGVELMLPRLGEANAEVRAAAVVFLMNHGRGDVETRAAAVLHDLLSDGRGEVRVEAAKALSAIPEPAFRTELVRLLYDRDPRVGREAIQAVRLRMRDAAEGPLPLYLPTLVSLMSNRRLKHLAREALVACGEPVIPVLTYFMNDPEEDLWVRRALPKTLAGLGTPAAAETLVGCLRRHSDRLLRRKLIEATGDLRDDLPAGCRPAIDREIRREIVGFLHSLRDLRSLEERPRWRLDGALFEWLDVESDPGLLEKLLIERLDDHLRNVFALLALIEEPESTWAAYRSLLAAKRSVRSHALEYLDNVVDGEQKRDFFTLVGDDPLEQKLAAADERFGVRPRPRLETLAYWLELPERGDENETHLVVAAVYTVYADRVSELYPRVRALIGSAPSFVDETARWVARRLEEAEAPAARRRGKV